MNPKELFNDVVLHYLGTSGSYGDWTHCYWELDFVIAEINKCYFSHLDNWKEKKDRTCELCGHVHSTNEFGSIDFCESYTCNELRQYFGFTKNDQRPIIANGKIGSKREQRATWLRKKLKELYGNGSSSTIYQMPLDCRLPMLLSMQIAREQIESLRTEGNVSDATCTNAEASEYGKQKTSTVSYGSCSSVH